MRSIDAWYFRLAVLYLLAGITLGIVMAASHDHSMFPVHAHLNLLGWVTMALFGLFYKAWPAAAASKLALIQFWLYVPAHFVMMVALFTLYRGVPAAEPVLGVTSIIVGLSILCFAVLVWQYAGERRVPAVPMSRTT